MSSVEEYCLSRSSRLRLRAADSRWLIRLAIQQLPPIPPRNFHRHQGEWRARLRASLTEAVYQRYGNPIVIWMLLNVILPVVIRLVIDWWLNRRDA